MQFNILIRNPGKLNMENLKQLIQSAKENDENAMLEIIEKFRPLINKYFKNSYYNEDVKSALVLKLIEVVKIELKFDSLREQNDGALVNYIVSSLYHQYLGICGKNTTKSNMELTCEDDVLISFIDMNKFYNEQNTEDAILFELLRTILTERELDCVYHIIFMGYTAEELSKKWHITKQACNQCKRRAFDKIRRYYAKGLL